MKTLLALVLALFAVVAHGQAYKKTPENGYWWNPNEPGRGWSFETQNDIVAITHYGYEAAGDSAFFQSAGRWNALDGTLTTELSSFRAGPCFGCPYVGNRSSGIGTVRFEFVNETSGSVTFPNGTRIPIEKFTFGYANAAEFQFGAWVTAWYSSTGSDFQNLFVLDTRCTSTTLPGCVSGSLKLNRAGRPVVSAPYRDTRLHLMLVDSIAGFYDYYYVTLSATKLYGLACTARTTSPAPLLTNCSGVVFGHRAADFIEARVLFGASSKRDDLAEQFAIAQRERELSQAAPLDHPKFAEFVEHEQGLSELAEQLRQQAEALRK